MATRTDRLPAKWRQPVKNSTASLEGKEWQNLKDLEAWREPSVTVQDVEQFSLELVPVPVRAVHIVDPIAFS
jgi:hypothetical protein